MKDDKDDKEVYCVYSKLDCPSCVKAQELLKSKGLEYTYLTLDKDFTLPELFNLCETKPRSFPVTFKGNKQLGGLKELQEHLGVSCG